MIRSVYPIQLIMVFIDGKTLNVYNFLGEIFLLHQMNFRHNYIKLYRRIGKNVIIIVYIEENIEIKVGMTFL